MSRATNIDELRALGRRFNRLVLVLMAIAFFCVLLEATALAPARHDTGPDLDAFYASAMLSLLTLVAACGQLLAAGRWSAWAAEAAKHLRAHGVSGLGNRRFGVARNWRRPAWVTSELVQTSTAAASWAGEWAPARVPAIVRAWWAAWVVRMLAGLAVALAIAALPERPGSDGFLLVAFMLRDFALLAAGPLMIMIVNTVDDSIEQALAEDGEELPSAWTRAAIGGLRLLGVVMMPSGLAAWNGGLGTIARSYAMALGPSQQLHLYGGIAALVAGTALIIGGFLLLLRYAPAEARALVPSS